MSRSLANTSEKTKNTNMVNESTQENQLKYSTN